MPILENTPHPYPMYCLDIDICEALLVSNPASRKRLSLIDPLRRYTSNVVAGELYVTVYRSPNPQQGIEHVHQMLLSMRIQKIDFDASAAVAYGKISAALPSKAFEQLKTVNIQVAALVLSRSIEGSHILLTRNPCYTLIPGISLESW